MGKKEKEEAVNISIQKKEKEKKEKQIKILSEYVLKNLKSYFRKKDKEFFEKGLSKEKDMLAIKGGEYKPSFFDKNLSVINLLVSKVLVTQKKYKELMGKDPSYFKGEENPVEQVSWLESLEFCNKLSEKYGLVPTYKIENSKLVGIQYGNGEVASPDKADFSKTEGYRLPTELEWEWFARGGEVAIKEGTFNLKYAGSNTIDLVAWYYGNSNNKTHAVGTKSPNQLGLYDCTGNVWEWCYDTATSGYMEEEKAYIYDESFGSYRLRGGYWSSDARYYKLSYRYASSYAYNKIGFRVVRTV